MAPFQDLPLDILHPILSQLTDRKDWHACTLVSKAFSRVATPFLYRTLDSRIISKTLVHHPSTTLLRRPDLAQHVRRVTETGAIHRGMLVRYPNITKDTLAALALCVNLASLTWIDDTASTNTSLLLSFLEVIRSLPVRELTIRTHSDLGEEVWAQLITLTGLRKVSIWCMEGPPRVLQGWSEPLGSTLTHLELGVSAFLYPCSELLSQLPLLKDLRLKGAPASAIPTILTYLPNLQSLDTEYLLSGSGSYYSAKRPLIRAIKASSPKSSSPKSPVSPDRPSSASSPDLTPSTSEDEEEEEEPPLPTLRSLTVRTSSMDNFGPQKLWGWIQDLVPRPGLEKFKLHAFTFNMGYTGIPRMFILELARMHGASLREFVVGEAHLTLGDIECLCSMFRGLEVLVCSVASPDVESIMNAISPAKNLTTLKLQVQWIPSGGGSAMYDQHDYDLSSPNPLSSHHHTSNTYDHHARYTHDRSRLFTSFGERDLDGFRGKVWRQADGMGMGMGSNLKGKTEMFTMEDARRMMLRSEESRLRVIGIGHVQYTGKWVLEDNEFEDGHDRDDNDNDDNLVLKVKTEKVTEQEAQEAQAEKDLGATQKNFLDTKPSPSSSTPPPPSAAQALDPAETAKKDSANGSDPRLRFVVYADVAEDRWKT